MDRHTRDKFSARTSRDLTTGNALWETPPAVFAKLTEDFGPFDSDLCANASNALCRQWVGPDHPDPARRDALTSPWGCANFANPPYGRPFVPALLARAALSTPAACTLLLPLRVTRPFIKWVLGHASFLYFCDHRIAFFEGGRPRVTSGNVPDCAMFDSIIVRFTPERRPLVTGVWNVPAHVPAEYLSRGSQRKASQAVDALEASMQPAEPKCDPSRRPVHP